MSMSTPPPLGGGQRTRTRTRGHPSATTGQRVRESLHGLPRMARPVGILGSMHSLAALGQTLDTPRLRGAACAGLPELFDPLEPSAATEAVALRICDGCPALTQCRRWFRRMPDKEKPSGVVAGRVVHRYQSGGTVVITVKRRAPRARRRVTLPD